jgi:hypothetical protein
MTTTAPITIRKAHPEEPGVLRIAALDSSRVPAAPLLVAEVNGQVRAVLSIEDGRTIADPFYPTSDLVELLRTRAALSRPAAGPKLLQRLALRPRPSL